MAAQEKILELIRHAAREAQATGTRIVLNYVDDGCSYQPDGYGGTLLIEDRDIHVTVAAEPAPKTSKLVGD